MYRSALLLTVTLTGLAGCETTRQVRFESDPPGATVFLGSAPLGVTPVSAEVAFAEQDSSKAIRLRAVRMELGSYEPMTRFISVTDAPSKKGENAVHWTLLPLQRSLRIALTTVPHGARVLVDGEDHGQRTPCIVQTTVTRSDRFEDFPAVEIALRKVGFEHHTVAVDPQSIIDDKEHKISITLRPSKDSGS